MKGCYVIKLEKPLNSEIEKILINKIKNIENNEKEKKNLINYINGDLRRLKFILNINEKNLLENNLINNSIVNISNSLDVKCIIKELLNKTINIKEHNNIINETNRTTLALMWHENIIDNIHSNNIPNDISIYLKMLDNFCFSDNIDRITFQNQIWQFNEMSSCIKTIYNNNLYHEYKKTNNFKKSNKIDIRFTKILTKYSSEYNNYQFLKNLSQILYMDLDDILSLFNNLKKSKTELESEILLDNLDITNLEISRIYKYLNIIINCDIE